MDYKKEKGYQPFSDKLLKPLEVDPEFLKVIHEGMYRVISGKEGSARHAFAESKI